MPKKFTQKEAENLFKNFGFNLLSQYNGTTSEVVLSCKNKHTLKTTYKNIKKITKKQIKNSNTAYEKQKKSSTD